MNTPLVDSPGMVALPTSEVGRFMLFTISLAGTIQPPNSLLQVNASASVTENLNQAFRDIRPQDSWVWIMGDDHCWPRDALMQMLMLLDERPGIDILVPLVVRRNPPWNAGLFHELVDQRSPDGDQLFLPITWPEITELVADDDVFEVDAAGSAGMLLRREVIDTIGDPWFYSTMDTEGRQVVLNEDLTFCLRARHEYGYKVWATSRATLGHLGIYNVRPIHREGRWGALTEFSSPEDQFREIFMPAEEAVSAAH